jgi:hypothetical protein
VVHWSATSLVPVRQRQKHDLELGSSPVGLSLGLSSSSSSSFIFFLRKSILIGCRYALANKMRYKL